jgi:hypothetical protein
MSSHSSFFKIVKTRAILQHFVFVPVAGRLALYLSNKVNFTQCNISSRHATGVLTRGFWGILNNPNDAHDAGSFLQHYC